MTAGQILAILGALALVVAAMKLHDFWLRHKKKKKLHSRKPVSDEELLK